MRSTKKRTTFAPITSASLRRGGLHVIVLDRAGRRTVKEKASRRARRKLQP